MNPELDEVRALLKRTLEVAEDTNRQVHKLRRAQLWGRVVQLVWWVLIIAVSGATYYLYLQPYVGKIEQLYEETVGSGGQQPSWNTQIQNFLKNIAPPKQG